jgi:hypothetical protein
VRMKQNETQNEENRGRKLERKRLREKKRGK